MWKGERREREREREESLRYSRGGFECANRREIDSSSEKRDK